MQGIGTGDIYMPRGIYNRKPKPEGRMPKSTRTNVYPFPRNPDIGDEHDSAMTLAEAKGRIAMLNTELAIARSDNELLQRRAALYERLLDKLSK